MLSENKSRKQWILSPRVTAWSQDDNKFGQRLLQQMGWQKGKGLGKDLNGNPDHIRPRSQSCSKGLGYEGTRDEWIAHQDELNSILTGLQSQYSQSSESDGNQALPSLELSSRKSRSRLHYQKFTRGKDLSRYSVEDMAAIMGNTNKPRRKSQQTHRDTEPTSVDEVVSDPGEKQPVVTFNSTLSLKDYFASKMKKRRADQTECDRDTDATSTARSEDRVSNTEEPRAGQPRRLPASCSDTAQAAIDSDPCPGNHQPHKKRKRNVEDGEGTNVVETTADMRSDHQPQADVRKKKKKRTKEV